MRAGEGPPHRARHGVPRVRSDRRWTARRRRRRASRSHDRSGAQCARAGRCAVPPRAAAAARAHCRDRARARSAPGGECGARIGALGGRDRLPARGLPRARARPDRRRAHDVRAGQLRALPAQDLQWRVDHRRREAGRNADGHDPRNGKSQSAGHGARLCRQCSHHARARRAALLSGRRRRVAGACGTHAYRDEVRDAQSPDRDLALSRRGDRCRRRDPRRGRHRARRKAQGRAGRLLGVQPALAWSAAAVGGNRRRQAGAHRVGARDHARRADRRRGLQQRIRPAEPGGIFPHLRDGSRGRSARLPQADHAGRRDRQHRRAAGRQVAAARGHAARPARRPGHADRHGRRCGILDGRGGEYRGPGLRFRAARQCRDRAARAGGDRPLLAAGRGDTDPVDPRRRRGRAVERAARAGAEMRA